MTQLDRLSLIDGDSGQRKSLLTLDLAARLTSVQEFPEKYEPVGDTAGWELGPQIRTRGGVNSDWWSATAADLANCGVVAVYPVSGWWRESRGNDWSSGKWSGFPERDSVL